MGRKDSWMGRQPVQRSSSWKARACIKKSDKIRILRPKGKVAKMRLEMKKYDALCIV